MKKKNKFNARIINYKGMTFDSKKEFGRYLVLKDMEKKGKIERLERQREVELIPKNKIFKSVNYIADFVYYDIDSGEYIWEDVKGLRKGAAYSLFIIKKKLMYNNFKIVVREI